MFPDGKERGLKFNQLAINLLFQKSDLDNWAATANYAAVWGGLKGNAYVKGEELDLDFETVCDQVDAMSNETMQSIDATLAESLAYKKVLESVKETTATKKKLVKPKASTVK